MEPNVNDAAFNAGHALNRPHETHGFSDVSRINHRAGQNYLAGSHLGSDQGASIAPKVPLEGGAHPRGDQQVHQFYSGTLRLGKGR
jgi:hypothetical protein